MDILPNVWFIAIAILWIGFLLLEGFDLGVGMHMLITAKDEPSKRVMLNTIGPVWDGNEVWLITAGAAIFAAFVVLGILARRCRWRYGRIHADIAVIQQPIGAAALGACCCHRAFGVAPWTLVMRWPRTTPPTGLARFVLVVGIVNPDVAAVFAFAAFGVD